MNRTRKYTYPQIRPLYPLIALGFALRLFRLNRQSLWFDDIIGVHLARLPIVAGLDGLLAQGIQLNPFYHWVIKIWVLIGNNESEWFLRFSGVCFSLVSIPLFYRLSQIYFDEKTSLLAVAIFTINPYQIWYAHEVRVYSSLTLAAIGAMFAFSRYLKHGKRSNLITLTGFHILGFHSHYFMFLLSTVQLNI